MPISEQQVRRIGFRYSVLTRSPVIKRYQNICSCGGAVVYLRLNPSISITIFRKVTSKSGNCELATLWMMDSFFKQRFKAAKLLTLPQIVVWRFLLRSKGSDVLATQQAIFYIILIRYIPRFAGILPLTSELKRTSGVFTQTAWAGAVTYLLLYMLVSHIVGALWYVFSVEAQGC